MLDSLRADIARFAEIKGLPVWRGLVEGLLFDNGLQAVVLHRAAHAVRRAGIPFFGPLIHRWSIFSTGVDIAPSAEIGPGLYVAHGVGLVVGGGCTIGARAFLLQQVTLGAPSQRRLGDMPVLGDDVFVGAGAKVLGAVHIGDRVFVGANAVVTADVPADSKAVLSGVLEITPRAPPSAETAPLEGG